jgi:ornithine cyclodeaminase/alanine dehydrogenase-like protein (mu-crystallin family)
MLFLSREDVRAVLETGALVDAIARALVELSTGRTDVPPRVAARTPDPGAVAEIGEVLAGSAPGRSSDEQITLYKSTGHAVEDAAAARLAFDRARRLGVGTILEL